MIDFGNVMRVIPIEEDDDYHPPAYGTKGWVLVEILTVFKPDNKMTYRFEIGESVVDENASPYWIGEGVGIEYWLDEQAPEDLKEGWWVFEGVVGTYHRGGGWISPDYCEDDDEEWEFETVRPATPEEIAAIHVETSRDTPAATL